MIRKHVLEHSQYKGSEFRCILPVGDDICQWACSSKLSCFNAHQKKIHGVCFDDGASHEYTAGTGFYLKGLKHARNHHSDLCLAGSRTQAKSVMRAGRERYRLRNNQTGFKVVDFSKSDKVLIRGRWYLPDRSTEIICREDGRWVIRGGGKIKMGPKLVNPEKVKNNTEHLSVINTPNDLFYQGEIPESVGKVINVSLPVVYMEDPEPAKAAPEKNKVPTEKATTEMVEETGVPVGALVTNDGHADDSVFSGEALDNEDGDSEAISRNLVEASSLLLGKDPSIYIEAEIVPQCSATVRSLIHTKIPNARAEILMHKSKINMHSAEVRRLEEEILYWEIVINSYKK